MPPRSGISRVARLLLLVHATGNIVQGFYALVKPQEYALKVGDIMAGSSDQALGAIGLGAIGMGLYQFLFVWYSYRPLMAVSIPMRLAFGGVMWSWGHGSAVIYDMCVTATFAIALWG